MKPNTAISPKMFFLAVTLSAANGATMVLDDFFQGGFTLYAEGQTSILEDIPTPLTARRAAYGSRTMDWQASLIRGSGVMTYSLSLGAEPTDGNNYFSLDYSRKTGGFSILGYESFALDITNLVGRGEVMAYVGYTANGISVPITGPGELTIPYSKLNTSADLGDVPSLRFRLIGLSSDFSVTLDRIALMPEPGGSSLLGVGIALMLMTRRRPTE